MLLGSGLSLGPGAAARRIDRHWRCCSEACRRRGSSSGTRAACPPEHRGPSASAGPSIHSPRHAHGTLRAPLPPSSAVPSVPAAPARRRLRSSPRGPTASGRRESWWRVQRQRQQRRRRQWQTAAPAAWRCASQRRLRCRGAARTVCASSDRGIERHRALPRIHSISCRKIKHTGEKNA
jgi:hypothetical protein